MSDTLAIVVRALADLTGREYFTFGIDTIIGRPRAHPDIKNG